MTDSKEPDHIGEVIAEDVAKRRVCHICVSAPRVEACPVCDPPSFSELRQQLAEVSNERDGLRDKYQRDVYGLNNEGDPIGGDPAGGYLADIKSLQLRLNASEARNILLEKAVTEMLRVSAIAKQGSGAFNRAIINLNTALAQSAPATCWTPANHQCPGDGVGACSKCPNAPATDEQGMV